MNNYTVIVPITGVLTICVRAENNEQAKQIAFNNADEVTIRSSDDNIACLTEWRTHEAISKMNVFQGVQNNVEVIED